MTSLVIAPGSTNRAWYERRQSDRLHAKMAADLRIDATPDKQAKREKHEQFRQAGGE